MASITKTLTGQIQGISIGANGQIYTGIDWVDASQAPDPKNPQNRPRALGRTQIRIEGDKILSNNVEIGPAPSGANSTASSLSASIKSAIESLISSGKIAL